MFAVYADVLDDGAFKHLGAKRTRAAFAVRSAAVAYLDALVARRTPAAGYDDQQAVWWLQENGRLTRYTIGAV
jgi:hypothetical protein